MFTDDDDYYEDIPTFIYLPLELQYAPTSRVEAVILEKITELKINEPSVDLICVTYVGRKNKEMLPPYKGVEFGFRFRNILAKRFPTTFVISEVGYFDFPRWNPDFRSDE